MGLKGFGRVKNWIGSDNFSAVDINDEFNNFYSNVSAPTISGASGDPATVSGMQSQQSPGTVGSEVLPVTIQDEIRELRYQLNQIIGVVGGYWYSPPPASLTTLNSSLTGLIPSPANRIVSGRITINGQPDFLTPNGAANSVLFKATATNFIAYINNVLTTFNADITLTGLTVAPGSNNTCVVNDAALSGTQPSKIQGERNTVLQIATVGSNITALAGKYAAFKVGTEVFIGEVFLGNTTFAATFTNQSPTVVNAAGHGLSANDQVIFSGVSLPAGVSAATIYFVSVIGPNSFFISLTLGGSQINTSATGSGTATVLKTNCIRNCFRGWFFNSSDASIPRAVVSNGATITLLKLSWIFLTNVASTPGLDVTYNRPTVSAITPTSPAIGDYWLDLVNSTWKKYSGSSFVALNAALIGVTAQDTTNTIAARSFDFANTFTFSNTIEVEYVDSADVRASKLSDRLSVYGTGLRYDYDQLIWNTSVNLDSGVTLAASTSYWCYVTPIGKQFISDVAPHQRRFDLLGDYHPSNPWRCVGTFTTDGSMNIVASSVSFSEYHEKVLPYNFMTSLVIPDNSIPSVKYADQSVTRNKIANGAYAESLSCGAFGAGTTGTFTQITNFIIGLKVSGSKRVKLYFASDRSGTACSITTTANNTCVIRIKRGGTVIGFFGEFNSVSTFNNCPNPVFIDDIPTANLSGTLVYTCEATTAGANQPFVNNYLFVAEEMS